MFLVREVQENFKPALCGASTLRSQSKGLFSEPPQKLLSEAHFGRPLLSLFCHIVDFHCTHLIDIWLFQNRIPAIVNLRSFDLNSNLTRQTPVKIAYKPGLDYLLECFLPCTFARIIHVLPEKFLKFSVTGGTAYQLKYLLVNFSF